MQQFKPYLALTLNKHSGFSYRSASLRRRPQGSGCLPCKRLAKVQEPLYSTSAVAGESHATGARRCCRKGAKPPATTTPFARKASVADRQHRLATSNRPRCVGQPGADCKSSFRHRLAVGESPCRTEPAPNGTGTSRSYRFSYTWYIHNMPLQTLWTAVQSSDLLRDCGYADSFFTGSRGCAGLQFKDLSKCSTNPQTLLLLEGKQRTLARGNRKSSVDDIRKKGEANE